MRHNHVVAVLLPGPRVKPNHLVIALPRSRQQNLAAKNDDYSTVHKLDCVYSRYFSSGFL
jgi:hypothetical protein